MNNGNSNKHIKYAFTLIEILVVLATLLIVIVSVTFYSLRTLNKGKYAKAQDTGRTYQVALSRCVTRGGTVNYTRSSATPKWGLDVCIPAGSAEGAKWPNRGLIEGLWDMKLYINPTGSDPSNFQLTITDNKGCEIDCGPNQCKASGNCNTSYR